MVCRHTTFVLSTPKSHFLSHWEVVKNGYFTIRLTIIVDPLPPNLLSVFRGFFLLCVKHQKMNTCVLKFTQEKCIFDALHKDITSVLSFKESNFNEKMNQNFQG